MSAIGGIRAQLRAMSCTLSPGYACVRARVQCSTHTGWEWSVQPPLSLFLPSLKTNLPPLTERKVLKCYILAKFNHHSAHPGQNYARVCACVCACMRACVHVCVCVCVRMYAECIITVGHRPKSAQVIVVAEQMAIWSDIVAV